MTRKEKKLNELKELLQHGYDVYIPSDDDYKWAYVTTPNGSLLYVQCGCYGGYGISYKYVSNGKCGSGCSCGNRGNELYSHIDLETMEIAENRGLTFAHKLNANLYTSKEQMIKGIRNFDNYFKLEKERCK